MKGMKAEKRIAISLGRSGAKVDRSPGSRGSADIVAKWPTGKGWMVQSKYSSVGKPASLSSRERSNLLNRAKRNDATPVLAQVTPDKIQYTSVKSGKKLTP